MRMRAYEVTLIVIVSRLPRLTCDVEIGRLECGGNLDAYLSRESGAAE